MECFIERRRILTESMRSTGFCVFRRVEREYPAGRVMKLGGDGKYSKTLVCPDGCVIFKLTAKPLGNENFHTGGFWDYPDETQN